MKIVLVTNKVTQYSISILENLYEADKIDLIHIVFLDKIKTRKNTIVKTIKKYGFLKLMRKIFLFLEYKIRTYINFKNNYKFTHEFAIANKISFQITDNLNSESCVNTLKSIDPDIILLCSCSQIVSKDFINIATKACINIHPSLLPRHKGPTPVFWTLFDGNNQAGYTFHVVNDKIDDGEIIYQSEVSISDIKSEKKLAEKIFEKAASNLENVLFKFYNNQKILFPKSDYIPSYEKHPTSEQRKQFFKMGFKS